MLKIRISRVGRKFRFLFVVLFSMMLSVSLSAFTSSTIKGMVYDKETGKPIEGAEVTVFYYDYGIRENHKAYIFPRDNAYTRKTDKNGKFVFYNMEPREYYISVKKDGYAEFSPYYFIGRRNDKVLKFKVKKGKTTYLKIGLERGGGVEIIVKKKTKDGISLIKGAKISVDCMVTQKIGTTPLLEYETNGKDSLKILTLIPETICSVRIRKESGLTGWVKYFKVKKGKIYKIERIYDFTINTNFKGEIITDSKRFICYINLLKEEIYKKILKNEFKLENKEYMYSGFVLKGKKNFEIKHLPPGKYRVDFIFADWTDNKNKVLRKSMIINLQENKQIIKKIDFRSDKK